MSESTVLSYRCPKEGPNCTTGSCGACHGWHCMSHVGSDPGAPPLACPVKIWPGARHAYFRERCEHFGTEHAEDGNQCELPCGHSEPHRFEGARTNAGHATGNTADATAPNGPGLLKPEASSLPVAPPSGDAPRDGADDETASLIADLRAENRSMHNGYDDMRAQVEAARYDAKAKAEIADGYMARSAALEAALSASTAEATALRERADAAEKRADEAQDRDGVTIDRLRGEATAQRERAERAETGNADTWFQAMRLAQQEAKEARGAEAGARIRQADAEAALTASTGPAHRCAWRESAEASADEATGQRERADARAALLTTETAERIRCRDGWAAAEASLEEARRWHVEWRDRARGAQEMLRAVEAKMPALSMRILALENEREAAESRCTALAGALEHAVRALGLAAVKFDSAEMVEAGAACRRDGERAIVLSSQAASRDPATVQPAAGPAAATEAPGDEASEGRTP